MLRRFWSWVTGSIKPDRTPAAPEGPEIVHHENGDVSFLWTGREGYGGREELGRLKGQFGGNGKVPHPPIVHLDCGESPYVPISLSVKFDGTNEYMRTKYIAAAMRAFMEMNELSKEMAADE